MVGDVSVTMPNPIRMESAAKSGHSFTDRLAIKRYMSAAAVNVKENSDPGESRMVLLKNWSVGT
jgi:hypothetical protein